MTGFPRPLLDLSPSSFAKVVDLAFGRRLNPPFDPYANTLNFLLASYLVPYVGLTGYVGSSPKLKAAASKKVNVQITNSIALFGKGEKWKKNSGGRISGWILRLTVI